MGGCPINFTECIHDKCLFWIVMDDKSADCAFHLAQSGFDGFVSELIGKAREFDETPLGQGLIKVVRNFLSSGRKK